MSAPRFLTQILSAHTRVFVTSTNAWAQELKSQLENYDKVQVVDDGTADVVIHLVGFESPTLADTLYHTSVLHQYLDSALRQHAKFILVTPHKKSSLVEVASTLVTQFGKNFGLHYKIIAVSEVEEILKSFLHRYQRPIKIVLPKPGEDQKRNINLMPVLVVLIVWIMSWLVWTAQVWLLVRAVKCAYLEWSVACAARAETLSRFLAIETPWVLGAKQAVAHQGYPLKESLVLVQRLTEGVRMSHSLDNLPQWDEYLAKAQAELKEFANASLQVPALLPEVTQKLSQLRLTVNKLNFIAPELPQILSKNRKSTYLILLQDNTELRTSGGFVGQIGLLTVDQGKISNLEWFDTYATDGQLRGQVSPPPQLKQILGENNWYLRDVNWDNDFPSVAARAAWFVNKELNRPVDWVVALNLSAVAKLLEINGPINGVDSRNLISHYLSQIKPNASPGFITNLMQAMPTTLSPEILGRYLLSALESRQIFMTAVSSATPRLTRLGWDGSLTADLSCRTQDPCLANWFYAVDTNIGINKVNPYVTRQIQINHNFVMGRVATNYRLNYSNTSPQTAWPLGTYRNFLRVYLPPALKIDKVITNTQYTILNVHGLNEVGVVINVPPGQNLQVEIQAHQDLPNFNRFHYQFDIPNQPGAFNDTLTLTLTYPKMWFAVGFGTPTVASSGRLEYNSPLISPQKFDVDFALK